MSAVRDISALRTIKGISIRDAGNVLRSIKTGFARDAGNVSRQVFTAFGGGAGLKASPISVSGFGNSRGSIAISTGACSVSATSGVPPYTYLWSKVSGDASWNATNPTGVSSAFRRGNVAPSDSFTSTWKCTVTDSSGSTADTNVVTANVENLNES